MTALPNKLGKAKHLRTGPTRLFYREQKPQAQYRLIGIATAVPQIGKKKKESPMDWSMRNPVEVVIPVYALPERLKYVDRLRSKRKKIDWKVELSDRKTRVYWEAKVTSIAVDVEPSSSLIVATIAMLRSRRPLRWRFSK